MPFDSADWMIRLRAADMTAAAFNSLQQRMKQTQIVADGVERGMSAHFAGVTRMLGPMAAGFTAAAIAHKIFTVGLKAGDLGEQAEQIGLTTDQLQAYRLEAAQNGVSVEQLDTAMMRLTRSMGEANGGSDDAIARFDKLGVKLLDTEKNLRKTSDVLPELARGLLAVKSETERNALMQEIFGRSGTRMVTMLEALAQGNDRVIASAKEQGAVIGTDAIKAWDEFEKKLLATKQQWEAFSAAITAPLATGGLERLNEVLASTAHEIKLIKQGWDYITSQGGRANSAGMEKEAAEIEARIARMGAGPHTSTQAVLLNREQSRLDALRKQIGGLQADGSAIFHGDTIRFTGKPGVSQPTGKGGASGKQGRAQISMEDLLGSIERERLDALEKASVSVLDKYGSGLERATRETEQLNEMLAEGFINSDIYGRAIEDVTAAYDDQSRALRGAAGGFEGYAAGIEQAFADMSRTNAAFEAGRQTVDLLSDALTELATTGEINFQKLLNSFLSMIIQMEMRAAASSVFKAIGGGSGIGGLVSGLIGGLFGGGSLSGAAVGGGTGGGYGTYALGGVFNRGNVIPFANGGIVNKPTLFPFANGTGLMGEAGPEAIMPLSRGADGKLGVRMDGGGGGEPSTIIVQQTNHFGSDVSRAEMNKWAAVVEARAREGATSAIIGMRRAGDPRVKGVF